VITTAWSRKKGGQNRNNELGIRIKIKENSLMGRRRIRWFNQVLGNKKTLKRSVRMESIISKKVANICPLILIKQKRF
jgi:hypothetical protein